MQLAFLTSRLRTEEKLLLQELERRGIPVTRVDDGELALRLEPSATSPETETPWDLVWNRSLAFGRALYAGKVLEGRGIRTLNSAAVITTCGDKLDTSMALVRAGVPTPETRVAFTPEAALDVIEEMGYPVVLKPVVGSWGRLVARLDNRTAAEAVLEDRAVLGSWQQQIFYLQEYVEKPGRDARVFVVGDQAIAGIWRSSEHWITNTARGGRTERCDVSGELGELALAAARAVTPPGDSSILAIDLIETPNGPTVLEVNHSGEFRNSIEPTGVDIPGAMVDHVLARLSQSATAGVDELQPRSREAQSGPTQSGETPPGEAQPGEIQPRATQEIQA